MYKLRHKLRNKHFQKQREHTKQMCVQILEPNFTYSIFNKLNLQTTKVFKTSTWAIFTWSSILHF